MDVDIFFKVLVVIPGVIAAVTGMRLLELALDPGRRRAGGLLSLLKRDLKRVLADEPGVAVAQRWSSAVAVAVLLTFGLLAVVIIPLHSRDPSNGGGISLLLVLCCLAVRIVVLGLQPVETEELKSTLTQVRWRTILLLTMGFSALAVTLPAGATQPTAGFWGILLQPLGFVLFAASAMLFCLPVSGRFVPLVIDDVNMIVVALLVVTVYCGGWHLWGAGSTSAVLQTVVLLAKTAVVLGGMVWLRRRCAACRFDGLEDAAWKWLLPLSGLNLLVSGGVEFGVPADNGGSRAMLGGITAAGVAVYLVLFHRGEFTRLADRLHRVERQRVELSETGTVSGGQGWASRKL